MDVRGRFTKRYSFRIPDVGKLKELASLVEDPSDFRKRYGTLLTLLNANVDEGLLKTFIQFYDPVYRCFTFPDYQLMPTLEEYAHILGISVSDKVPFNGLEAIPKSAVIATMTHLKKSEIDKNLTTKGKLLGLTSKFLMEKALKFFEAGSMVAFEVVLALLIYGLVLFPNVPSFVDINAIRIFLIGNPVPTLLGDTYFSIHHRNRQGDGTIVCCVPLFFKWIVSHLPKFPIFRENKNGWHWSRRLMSLTNDDIYWYTLADNEMEIIESCGEFANVPLIGTKGGINYNPFLARRQLGYANSSKPFGFTVESYFYLEEEDSQGLKSRMIKAWHHIRRKEKGKAKNCVAMETYTSWVKKRAKEFRMPYAYEEPMFSAASKSTIFPVETMGDYQGALTKIRFEKEALENKFLKANLENEKLKNQVKEHEKTLYFQDEWLMEKDEKIRQKDNAIQKYVKEKKRKLEEMTTSDPAPNEWKRVINKLKAEKAELKARYGKEILKLKLQQAFGSSSDEDV